MATDTLGDAAASGADARSQDAPTYDIVVVGAGPAGLMLSTCLARWGYRIKQIDDRPEPTRTGRADGIQPRSLDLLRNMGLKADIMAHKPARVYEVAFWGPSPLHHGITRTGTWASCPSLIDARYPFTTALHQGHIERVFLGDLERNGVSVQRPWTVQAFCSVEREDPEYPVRIQLQHVDGHASETVRAKYLFGGDGAKSAIRQQLHIGFQYRERIEHVWGVIDGIVQTDFPDIKMKCTVHSRHGSAMVIPREDGMVRLYVQITSLADKTWDPRRRVTEAQVQESARRILQPYSIDWQRIEWFSMYPIGQGIASHYTLDQRIFLGGDVCHTHSVRQTVEQQSWPANDLSLFGKPKAGQGMNMAFSDAINLAWKLHAVEGGLAHRRLLETYQSERKATAESLLDFDSRYAKLFSQRPPARQEIQAAAAEGSEFDKHRDDEFVKTFKDACYFTSGYGVRYGGNILNWSAAHPAQSPLIQPKTTGLLPGGIFMSANVTRVVDANVVHLEQEIPMNGTFRIYVFAGHPHVTRSAVRDFAKGLGHRQSFYAAYTRPASNRSSGDDKHASASRFFTLCTVLAVKSARIDVARDLPGELARYRDHIYADDVRDGRVPGADASAHAKMELDVARGGVVVVRPDGHVGVIANLVEGSGTVDALNEYFSAFCTQRLGAVVPQL